MIRTPAKRKRARMGVEKRGPFRSHRHLQFIRGRVCAICGANEGIEAAHVRWRTDGSLSAKPSDYWTLPLCREHHRIGDEAQHSAAKELAFYASHGIEPYELCTALARESPDMEVREHARTMRARI